jgi:hypothetical protein
MSNFTPLVDLSYADGSNPIHYGLNISMDGSEDYSIMSASSIQSHPDDPNGYIIVLDLSTDSSEGSVEYKIDLGELPLESSEGFIDIHFENDGTLIEKRKVRTQEAQKESRPIELI